MTSFYICPERRNCTKLSSYKKGGNWETLDSWLQATAERTRDHGKNGSTARPRNQLELWRSFWTIKRIKRTISKLESNEKQTWGWTVLVIFYSPRHQLFLFRALHQFNEFHNHHKTSDTGRNKSRKTASRLSWFRLHVYSMTYLNRPEQVSSHSGLQTSSSKAVSETRVRKTIKERLLSIFHFFSSALPPLIFLCSGSSKEGKIKI